MKYKILEDNFEDHSVWNTETGVKVAEHIPFASCAYNLIFQLDGGRIDEENIAIFKPKGKTQ